MKKLLYACLLLWITLICSCSKGKGPMGLFKKMSPHDQYGQRLKDAGLDATALGRAWLQKASNSFANTLNITVPYKETGYFDGAKANVTVLRFDVKRGQKLHVSLVKKPAAGFMIFADLWQERPGEQPKLLASQDTTGPRLDYDVDDNGKYLLRLQPELLRGGEYTLTITNGPSLGFPVSAVGKPRIESFWGAARDAGARRHEGIDIFAPKGTPAIASANGIVTRVTENKLGGLVVFMQPENKDYSLYYAHLTRQIARDGQPVHQGDTLGLVGNTGNAAGGPTHLHFGIYTFGGAIDPLPFVDREIRSPKPVSVNIDLLNTTVRLRRNSEIHMEPTENSHTKLTLPVNTILTAEAGTDSWYKVSTPGGDVGFVPSRDITASEPIERLTLRASAALLDAPEASAPTKKQLTTGARVQVLGRYQGYQLVSDGDTTGWIK